MIDGKIVEQLRMGKSLRAAAREVGAGFRRVKKIAKVAQEACYLDLDLPAFPEALFEDAKRLPSLISDAEAALLPHKEWIIERLGAGWHKVTVYEELCSRVPLGCSFSLYFGAVFSRTLGPFSRVKRA